MEWRGIGTHLATGLAIRLLAVAYSVYHDAHNVVKYTDIDYSVFNDGAAYIIDGKSPYLRETYRYTPLLAWLLTPNLTVFANYGKILFSLFDMLACYLIYRLTMIESKGNQELSQKCSCLWIYNPLPIIICSRGSAESIIISLVLAAVFFTKKNATAIAGIIYGFAVHFKLYPIAYCLPLYLCTPLGNNHKKLSFWKNVFTLTPLRFNLVLGSVIGFGIPTLSCYLLYGDEYLQESYFYHLTRKDIRHNFSMYFYMLYLNWSTAGFLGFLVSILTFAPQALLVIAVAVLFRSPEDLCFTIFIQTSCFVSFNKVCTSQYFLWYLSMLPVLVPTLQMKRSNGTILLFVWYFAQIAWLLPAYFLEFEGRNVFMYVWLESIAFFSANVGILVQIIKNYRPN
jgi:phosphatidylinositol glycan class M